MYLEQWAHGTTAPPSMAHEKGLDQAYEFLSDELLRHIRLALLYAVNEW